MIRFFVKRLAKAMAGCLLLLPLLAHAWAHGPLAFELFNPQTGYYLWTADLQEQNQLLSQGWIRTWVGAWATELPSDGVPICRFRNVTTNDRGFTTCNFSYPGWVSEGVAFYSHAANGTTCSYGKIPVYISWEQSNFGYLVLRHQEAYSPPANYIMVGFCLNAEGKGE